MRLQEAASQLNISERSLYRLIQEGLLQHQLETVYHPAENVYTVDAGYIAKIRRRLSASRKHKRVAAVRAILQELKKEE